MKLNMKDNRQWIAAESKKRKVKIIVIIGLFIAMVVLFGISKLYSSYIIKTGKIYPQIVLQDAPGTESPVVQTTVGYEKVVKTPTLPYTMTVKGDVVSEGASICTLLIDGDYVTICEISSAAITKEYLKDALIPSLGAQPTAVTTFNEQRGFLNSRYIETEADTIATGEKKPLYCMSYRLIIGGSTDILINGISFDTDMEALNNKLQSIFYSIYQLADAAVKSESQASESIDNISVNEETTEYPSTDIDMDSDYVINGSEPINPKNYNNHIYDIDENTLYKTDEEKVVDVDETIEEAVFLFSYQRNVELKKICLIDPEGKEYQYNQFVNELTPRYVFYVNNPMQGEWKFVYTVPEHIGYFRGQVMKKATYDESLQEPTPVARDNA